MAKRAFDLIAAVLGLLALSPLLVAVAVWVKLDSPGPVLYRQERVGRHGRLFRLHKFRTMRVANRADAPQITARGDHRITRAGRLLRHAKLDELPQLLDVMTGRMSLVGPRPEVPRYVALYPPDLRQVVLSVRPGLTDPATLAYRHEESLLAAAADPEALYVGIVLPDKLRLSADYVRRASFSSDLAVLATTVKAILARPEIASRRAP